jgi:cytochrome c553
MRRVALPALASVLLLAGVADWGMARPASAQAVGGPPGASSCTGCHAAGKVPDSTIPHIAGRSAGDIAKAMREYRSGAWPSSVMGRITKGFDDQQIDALAVWFAKQPE